MSEKTFKCSGIKSGKSSKPLIERQRRARINKRLEEIKDLILSFMYQDNPQMYGEKSCVRMDKAEILDFAVDFIKSQRFLQHAPHKTILATSYKQFPMPQEHFISPPPLQCEHPVLGLHSALSHTPKQPIVPRTMPILPLTNLVGYPTSYRLPCYGLDSPIPSPPEVKQPGTVQDVSALKIHNSEGIWRPWS